MNNFYRELAPITDVAWEEIEEEARQTFTNRIAGRRTVDVPEAHGYDFAGLETGHISDVDAGIEGVEVSRRDLLHVVELKVPFTLSRREIDNVARGAADSDWAPVQEAAATLARAEDRVIFYGLQENHIVGVVEASREENTPIAVPEDVKNLPTAVAQAKSELKLAEVQGPFALLLPTPLYTAVSETTDHGYPIYEHINRILGEGGKVRWAPALDDPVLVSLRGGDYELHLGQDVTIGYDSHDGKNVNLYLTETFTFRANTPEAAVVLTTK